LEALAEALVRPLVALCEGENREVMLLILQVRTRQTDLTGGIMREQFRPLHEKFVDALTEALPHLSRAEIALRYDGARGATLQTLVDLAPATGLVSGLPPERPASESLVRALTTFVTAGFAAPATT
jgi:hypothetical protein